MFTPNLRSDGGFQAKTVSSRAEAPTPPSSISEETSKDQLPAKQNGVTSNPSSYKKATSRKNRRYTPKRKFMPRDAFDQIPFYDFSSLTPRPFDQLHTERCYLLHSLQQENEKATELLRKFASIEEVLSENVPGQSQKATRKHFGWLKQRLSNTTGQERAILARLGQISHEIQCRERWSQIENEPRQEQMSDYQMGYRDGMQQKELNPTTPCFVPQGYANIGTTWMQPQWTPQLPMQYIYQQPAMYQPPAWQYPSPPYNSYNSELSTNNCSSEDDFQQSSQPVPSEHHEYRPPLEHRDACFNIPQLPQLKQIETVKELDVPLLRMPEPAKFKDRSASVSMAPVETIEAPERRCSFAGTPSRPSLIRKASSLNLVPLSPLATSNERVASPSSKRKNSLPSIPDASKIWAPKVTEEILNENKEKKSGNKEI